LKLQWRLAALKNGFQEDAAYRFEFLLGLLGSAAVPAAIQVVLWYALFKVGGATEVAGLTYSDLIAYTLVSTLFTQVRGGDHDFDLQEMIRSGSLSNYLLRPVGVVEFVYLRGIGGRLFTAAVCMIVGAVVMAFFGMDPIRLFGAMTLALIGNILHYQIGAALATTAFAWEEAYSVLMVKNMLVQLLSGELLPLTLFPEKWAWIWKSTPFYLYVFGPTQYALGKWSHLELLQAIGTGCLWMLGAWLLIRITWGIGIRNYSSLGS
jgi:ABC-2 type transport system permease protein